MSYLFPPPAPASLPILGLDARFPVHRIYCVARNYEEHAREMGRPEREAPFFFMKPADAVLPMPASETAHMPYPTRTANLHHEIELVLAIGRGGSNIAPEQALEHIYGYAVGLDMTRRDLQLELKQHGRPWCISKAFEHSAPVGPIVPQAQCGPMDQAEIRLQVNAQERQHGYTHQMIWSPAEIIAQLSAAWTLQAGDLIFTGTPAGVGPVRPSDLLTGNITGLPPISLRIA